MNMTCCPQYTIRCEVLNFKMRKSHKKIMKKVNRYLIHGIKPEKDNEEDEIEGNQSKSVKREDQSATKTQSVNQSSDMTNNNQSETSTGTEPRVSDAADMAKDRVPKPGMKFGYLSHYLGKTIYQLIYLQKCETLFII